MYIEQSGDDDSCKVSPGPSLVPAIYVHGVRSLIYIYIRYVTTDAWDQDTIAETRIDQSLAFRCHL